MQTLGLLVSEIRVTEVVIVGAKVDLILGASGEPNLRARPTALLRGCRAFAMPSRASRAAAQFEGFGIVYIEAARAGRPAIAARAASADEVVTDGVTGILVDPDAPLSFAAGALTLLDDAALSDRLGAAARTRADANFTWEHATARLAAALAPVVA